MPGGCHNNTLIFRREVSGLSRAVKSIPIYLESTYGPMTSALTLSASKRSASSDDVRHTDEQRSGQFYAHIEVCD